MPRSNKFVQIPKFGSFSNQGEKEKQSRRNYKRFMTSVGLFTCVFCVFMFVCICICLVFVFVFLVPVARGAVQCPVSLSANPYLAAACNGFCFAHSSSLFQPPSENLENLFEFLLFSTQCLVYLITSEQYFDPEEFITIFLLQPRWRKSRQTSDPALKLRRDSRRRQRQAGEAVCSQDQVAGISFLSPNPHIVMIINTINTIINMNITNMIIIKQAGEVVCSLDQVAPISFLSLPPSHPIVMLSIPSSL